MRDVVIEPLAKNDLAEAIAHYDLESDGLGLQFLAEVKKFACGIAENPRVYAAFQGKTRRAVLSRFPYVLLYQFDDTAVYVLGVFHERRSPRTIRARSRRKRHP